MEKSTEKNKNTEESRCETCLEDNISGKVEEEERNNYIA